MRDDNKGRVKKGLRFSFSKGFTLIELLVSSAIFITIGTIIVTILSVSFQVSQKAELTLALRSNGSAALSQMTNSIKYAKSLDDPEDCTTPIDQDSITFTSAFDGGQTTLSCPSASSPSIASNGASLLDTNAVSIQNCYFSCSQITNNEPPTITIHFDVVATQDRGVQTTPIGIPFQTAVTMRNYVR